MFDKLFKPKKAEHYIEKAVSAYQKNNDKKALALLNEGLERFPDSDKLWDFRTALEELFAWLSWH